MLLSLLAEIVSVIPASTSKVEGVSVTRTLSSLNPETDLVFTHLDQLLSLRFNSPETHDFPLQQAYKNWVILYNYSREDVL